LTGTILQQGQQHLPVDRRHPVAAATNALSLESHLDLVPVAAVLGEPVPQHRIGLVERRERPAGEHDTEPERVIGPIALEDGDLDGRGGPTHECCEEQPTGSAAHDGDAHHSSSTITLRSSPTPSTRVTSSAPSAK